MKTIKNLAPVLLVILLSCQQPLETIPDVKQEGMVTITIMYPNDVDKTFDMDYYANKHMPMLAELFGETMKGYEIDKGISGRTPEDEIPFLAIGYMYFDKLSDYQEVFAPNAEKILNDIPNYTNIRPIVQISEIVK